MTKQVRMNQSNTMDARIEQLFSQVSAFASPKARALATAGLSSVAGEVSADRRLESAFRAANSIDAERDRAESLVFLVNPPQWNDPLTALEARLTMALAEISEVEARLIILGQLVQKDSGLWRAILDEVTRTDDEKVVFDALIAIPMMDLESTNFDELAEVVRSLGSAERRNKLAINLAYMVPQNRIDELIELGSDESDESLGSRIRVMLESIGPESFDRVASVRYRLNESRGISDPVLRARSMMTAMIMLGDETHNVTTTGLVLNACAEIADEHTRASLIAEFASCLPGGVAWGASRIVELARGFSTDRMKARVLHAAVTAANSDSERDEVLAEAMKLDDPWARAFVLTPLAYFRRERMVTFIGGQDLFKLVEAVPNVSARSSLAIELAYAGATGFLQMAETSIVQIERPKDVVMQVENYSDVSHSTTLIPFALNACERVIDPRWKTRALATLARRLPESEGHMILLDAAELVIDLCDEQEVGSALRDVVRCWNYYFEQMDGGTK